MNKLNTQPNINFKELRNQLIGTKLLWVELPACTIDFSNDCYLLEAVSYTHLTLPTIYSV